MSATQPPHPARPQDPVNDAQESLRPAEATLARIVAGVSRLVADVRRSNDELILAVMGTPGRSTHEDRDTNRELPDDCVRQIRGVTARISGVLWNTRTMTEDVKRCRELYRELSQRLLEQQEQQQRRRLARDLHNTMQQSLAALLMHLDALQNQAAHLDVQSTNALRESYRAAERCCEELRVFVSSLRRPAR